MQSNKTKAKLEAGEVVFGSEIMFPSADVVEILAYAGLDFVYMDMEHSATTHESLAHMIRAAEIGGATPLVRIPESVPGHYPGVSCASSTWARWASSSRTSTAARKRRRSSTP